MSVIVHLADLHISASETEYCFAVLDEIMELSRKQKADFVIMAGDIFNSGEDLFQLRAEFRRLINQLSAKSEVLFIPGNHEFLQGNKDTIKSLDLGKITLLTDNPCSFVKRGNIEFIAIPHQDDYKEYRDWNIQAKGDRITRVAIAHASISGMSFTGLEEGGAVMDLDLFDYFGVDYAALGHIHNRRALTYNKSQLCYPGSARVWRRGETGAHGIHVIRMEDKPSLDFIPLQRAGEYREYRIPVSFDGIPEIGEAVTSGWKLHDWVDLYLFGIVENENALKQEVERLENLHTPRVRRLNIYREGITVFAGISSHPIARKFVQLWKSNEPAADSLYEKEVWLEAREIGLEEIKAMLEARE